VVKYGRPVVCPGLKLDWDGRGLVETLGRNGVTSNYRYDLAPYTWELVKGLKGPGDLHPAADADQMRRRAAEGALSLGRSLVPAGRAQDDIDIQFMQCRRRAVRRQGLRARRCKNT
jgi:sulfide:quinone oxidoreductase